MEGDLATSGARLPALLLALLGLVPGECPGHRALVPARPGPPGVGSATAGAPRLSAAEPSASRLHTATQARVMLEGEVS